MPGLRTAGLRDVLADLAALGFDAEWTDLAAVDVGAPHKRQRLFLVATDPDRVTVRDEPGWLGRSVRAACQAVPGRPGAWRDPSKADCVRRLESAIRFAEKRGWSRVCGWSLNSPARVDDGIPRGLVGARRRSLRNAVVVRCAELVGMALRSVLEMAA